MTFGFVTVHLLGKQGRDLSGDALYCCLNAVNLGHF